MIWMLPCSRSGIATVLWATDSTVTFSPAWVKYPSLSATCRPAVSSTGSDPTTMFVIAVELLLAEALAELEAEAEAEVLLAALLLELLELLHAEMRIVATARPATSTRDSRVNFMRLLLWWV